MIDGTKVSRRDVARAYQLADFFGALLKGNAKAQSQIGKLRKGRIFEPHALHQKALARYYRKRERYAEQTGDRYWEVAPPAPTPVVERDPEQEQLLEDLRALEPKRPSKRKRSR